MTNFFDDLKKYRNVEPQKTAETILEAESSKETSKESKDIIEENNFYFNQLNPDTGFRFNIPMLDTKDPQYFYKYIYYMKIKEVNEETFKKIMGWE